MTWPCGHPRTPENEAKRQCRTCRAARRREQYAQDPEFAESERERSRSNYDSLDGLSYNRRLMQNRRVQAMRRRRARDLRRNQEG